VHSWSGDSHNLALDPRSGGCFCERLPARGDEQAGGVEHGRVIFVRPPHMLRLASALGPLQGDAVSGVLTFTIVPADSGHSTLTLHYIVGRLFPRRRDHVCAGGRFGPRRAGRALAGGDGAILRQMNNLSCQSHSRDVRAELSHVL